MTNYQGIIFTLKLALVAWNLTGFRLTSAHPICKCETKTKIECEAYKALMTVWNSSKSEKVLTITNTHSHTLTLKDASEHPISLQNIFQHERIGEHYYYKTFLGQYLSVGKRGHLSIQTNVSLGVAKFLRQRFLSNTSADVYLMCAYTVDMETNESTSYLVSPFRPALRLNESSCMSPDAFRREALSIVNRKALLSAKPSLKREDFYFLHVHVNEPLNAEHYLSKELKWLCRKLVSPGFD